MVPPKSGILVLPEIVSSERIGAMAKKYYILEWDRYYLSSPMVSIYDLKAVVVGNRYFDCSKCKPFWLYRATTDTVTTDISAYGTEAHVYCFDSKRDAQMFLQGVSFGMLNTMGFECDTDETTLFLIKPTSGYCGKYNEPYSTHLYKILDRAQFEAMLATDVFTVHTTIDGATEARAAMDLLRSGYRGRYKNCTCDESIDYELYYSDMSFIAL